MLDLGTEAFKLTRAVLLYVFYVPINSLLLLSIKKKYPGPPMELFEFACIRNFDIVINAI